MASVVTEHMLLMVPMMIVVILFPMVAGFVVNNYNNEQRVLMVEQSAAKMGSAIQQLYLVACDEKIEPCNLTLTNPIPANIDGQQYVVTATKEGDSLTLHFGLPGINVWYDHKLTLGKDAFWDHNSSLDSNSQSARIILEKKASGEIHMGFG